MIVILGLCLGIWGIYHIQYVQKHINSEELEKKSENQSGISVTETAVALPLKEFEFIRHAMNQIRYETCLTVSEQFQNKFDVLMEKYIDEMEKYFEQVYDCACNDN